MKWQPPIKGKFLKKTLKPDVTGNELVNSISSISEAVTEIQQIRDDVIETVDSKIEEIDSSIQLGLSDLEEKSNALVDHVTSNSNEALAYIKTIKQGNPGKDADENAITERITAQIPAAIDTDALEQRILSKVPKIDEKSLTKKILKAIPENKASLKVIQEKIEVDPISVIEKIMALPDGKFKLKSSQIDGLEQTMSAFRNQLGRGYLHGGGISNITGLIKAGTNVTITGSGTKTDPYIINSSGSGTSLTLETNSVLNGSQTLLNLVQGSNMTITDDGVGNITFASTGSGVNFGIEGQIPFMNPTNDNFDYTNDLFWDASNGFLGIKTNTPQTSLDISGTNIGSNFTGAFGAVLNSPQKIENTITATTGANVNAASFLSLNLAIPSGTISGEGNTGLDFVVNVDSGDGANYDATSLLIGIGGIVIYQGTGSVNTVIGAQAAVYRFGSGTINNVVNIQTIFNNFYPAGTIDSIIGLQINSPTNTAGATITTILGINIADQTPSAGTLTNPAYAIFQGGANDYNSFNGFIQNSKLSGGGTQMVVADNLGILGVQAIPTFTLSIGDPIGSSSINEILTVDGSGNLAQITPSLAYTLTNVFTDRSYDANSTTIDELADVLGTLIADLQTRNLLG